MSGVLSLKTPSNGLVTLTPVDTATNKDITVPATTGTMVVQDATNTTTLVNISYSGTLTGGTGVVNIGSGQVYKDASGNVGIGSSSLIANTKLDVRGRIRTGSGSSSGDSELTWSNYASLTSAWLASVRQDVGGTNNELKFLRCDSSGAFQGIAMQITSASGNVGINTSTPTQRLSVAGNINSTGGQIIAGSTAAYSDGSIGFPSLQWNAFFGAAVGAVSIADTTATASSIYFRNPNGFVGNINTNGSSTNYVTTSDYRLKENVLPMQNALATVAALKPCTYTWKVDGNAGQGFIAHELQEVVPDCVTGEKDAVSADGSPMYQGVDTSFLVATLVAAIQELTARLEAVENK